ncbi:immunoglobulin domain-containing protein [Acanthopleuribacter pedis]|uniref:Immunoglobulin domain-containing protein n=1 Tax=Acanthopleuribacter pedis TaxID=442870 RepID=A0A8J7QLA6_9BACT|nr:immunoglobulin domain-containing protein [Acanthopleuribacter pedis]MBO1323201.1 immunoglobulin domain-containing protein [Acanthopleuribacter pedis]
MELQRACAPAIETQPGDLVGCLGETLTLETVASGSPLSYQWFKDGVMINGATQSQYQLSSLATGDAGRYTCLVTGDCGSLETRAAEVTLHTAVALESEPAGVVSCDGGPARLEVTASGSVQSYQWYKGNDPLPGATDAVLPFEAVTNDNRGMYFCRITGNCDDVVDTASVEVLLDLPAYDEMLLPDWTGPPSRPCTDLDNNQVFEVLDLVGLINRG